MATLALGGFIYGLLRRFAPVAPVLEHELTHGLAALLLLARPVEIHANEREGHAVHTAVGLRGTLVRLAPYVLPTVPLVVLPLGWVVQLLRGTSFLRRNTLFGVLLGRRASPSSLEGACALL